jgi:two-component system, sporulation sensor kinase E
MKSGFLDKLIERLDKLDPQNLQAQFLHLARERGLLDTIFQSIQEGVIVLDAAGRLNYANRAAELMLGFSAATTRGRPFTPFLPDLDWDLIMRFDDNEWSRMITREIEISHPAHRFVSFYVVPLPHSGKDNEPAAMIMLRDITRDREQEASLLESERFNAMKTLAAGVAHEIGNPLNALNIHLQLLDREIAALSDAKTRDSLAELVGISRNEIARLDLIITRFLRAIRPGRPELRPLQIETVLQETISVMKQELEDKNIQVEILRPHPLPQIHADGDQLKQAFFNVIRNAYQAMPGGGLLRIALTHSDTFVSIAFHDNGNGIAPEQLSSIFEPYHTTKPGGTGLGLMITRRIIEEHGGQIEVSSKPDEGACFTLQIPLAERRIRLLASPENVNREKQVGD